MGMEFEFGKNLRRENNWETRTGGISTDLSISPSRREHFFAPTEGNIYTHVCFISNLITFCRDTFVYRIAEIYMANTVAPLIFEFSRGGREREIPDSRQIANPTSTPRVISTSQIFARQFYATLLYYLNDLLPSPNFFVLRSDDFCTSNRTLISYSLETSIKNDVGGEATSNFTSSSSFSFFYSETHRYKSSARISLDRTRFFRNIIYNVKNVSASNFRLTPPPSSSIVLIFKRGLIRSNFVAQVYPFVSLLLFSPHRLETRAAATQTFAQR